MPEDEEGARGEKQLAPEQQPSEEVIWVVGRQLC